MWDLVPWPGIKPASNPCTGKQILNHWTASEAPGLMCFWASAFRDELVLGLECASGNAKGRRLGAIHPTLGCSRWYGHQTSSTPENNLCLELRSTRSKHMPNLGGVCYTLLTMQLAAGQENISLCVDLMCDLVLWVSLREGTNPISSFLF